jgi:hypothetical protein
MRPQGWESLLSRQFAIGPSPQWYAALGGYGSGGGGYSDMPVSENNESSEGGEG